MRRIIGLPAFLLLFAVGTTTATAQLSTPDISANILGRYRYDSQGSDLRTDALHNGFSLEESEVQFVADVDPYFRANILLSLTQKDGTTDFGIDPEEVYFETIGLPSVTVRAGKFKAALGKQNQLHTHAYPFIDAPLINQDLLGEEGLNEVGLSAALLVPVSWFMEMTVQALSTNNDILFNSPNSNDLAALLYLKNLWDLSEALTLEVGAFGVAGNNQFDAASSLFGGDLTFKWRPVKGGKYQAFIWQTEYMNGTVQDRPSGENLAGAATWLQYQFAQRWWVEGRAEYEGLPHSSGLPVKQKESALLAFLPSEFSGFRLQYDFLQDDAAPSAHIVTLQFNVSIGAHPAHAY